MFVIFLQYFSTLFSILFIILLKCCIFWVLSFLFFLPPDSTHPKLLLHIFWHFVTSDIFFAQNLHRSAIHRFFFFYKFIQPLTLWPFNPSLRCPIPSTLIKAPTLHSKLHGVNSSHIIPYHYWSNILLWTDLIMQSISKGIKLYGW